LERFHGAIKNIDPTGWKPIQYICSDYEYLFSEVFTSAIDTFKYKAPFRYTYHDNITFVDPEIAVKGPVLHHTSQQIVAVMGIWG
jgi:hypothetical protein